VTVNIQRSATNNDLCLPLFRAELVARLRAILRGRGFVEFSTPFVRNSAGTCFSPRARLENGLYLRDSPSPALRSCLRYHDRIYEVGPCFRPEIPSPTRLREFTMLDLYWRDASVRDAVNLAEELILSVYAGPCARISAARVIQDVARIDLVEDPSARDRLQRYLTDRYPEQEACYLALLDRFFDDEIVPLSEGQCLIVEESPVGAEVTAATKAGTCHVADRAEIIIDRVEVVHVLRDESDGDAMWRRAVAHGEFKAEDKLTADLLCSRALPACSAGFGIGIERLCRVLTGEDIRGFVPCQEF
jgi:lysyl-tRNA synthetase, class II